MGKYDSYIIQKILFFRAPLLSFTYCGPVTEFTMLHLRCLKYDSNAIDSNNDEDDYLSESSGSEDN